MQFGRYYEEFEVGAVYKHWPGKTVTEYDDHLFCLLTMNHHPLHLDAHYAQETTDFKRNVVVGNYVYSLLLGMSVADVSGKAIANLEVESLRHIRPTFHGDTLYGETEVLSKTPSRSKDDRGVVYVETRGLQPGRHGRLRVPPEGDGADPGLRRRAGRRAAGTAGAEGVIPACGASDHPTGWISHPGEGVPLREGVEQPVDERERRHGRPVDEPGVQRVVAGAQRAVDDRAAVVGDGERSALHPADQLVRVSRAAPSPRASRGRGRRRRPRRPRPGRPGTDHSPRPGSLARCTSSSRPASS